MRASYPDSHSFLDLGEINLYVPYIIELLAKRAAKGAGSADHCMIRMSNHLKELSALCASWGDSWAHSWCCETQSWGAGAQWAAFWVLPHRAEHGQTEGGCSPMARLVSLYRGAGWDVLCRQILCPLNHIKPHLVYTCTRQWTAVPSAINIQDHVVKPMHLGT